MSVRRCLPVVVAAALIVFAASAPAATSPSLPRLFATQIGFIKRSAHAPAVLLPASLPIDDHGRLYPEGSISPGGYDLELGGAPHCSAGACFLADFSAQKAKRIPPGDSFTPVTVTGASAAAYHPLQCGGSCSPPEIEYLVRGVVYLIQANITGNAASNRSTLIAAAEASITAGPR